MDKCCMFVRLLLVGAGLSTAVDVARAIGPTDRSTTSIQQLLIEESKGEAVDRSQALRLDDVSDFSRWQAGMVQREDGWISIDQLTVSDPEVIQYTNLRDSETLDLEGHRKLARWCRQHKLDDQANAHWHAILDIQPRDAEARRKLGHQLLAGNWYTPAQVSRVEQISAAYSEGLHKWLPACQSISRALARDINDKADGLKRLREIDDENAIPAMEQMALQATDATASPWILAIAKHRSTIGCLALARIALGEPGDRSQLAIAKLKNYPRELFVPELLSLLATPIETKIRYGLNDSGELLVYRALFRTTNSERQLVEFERLVRVNNPKQLDVNVSGFFSIAVGYRSQNAVPSVGSKTYSKVDIKADEVAAAKSAAEDQALFEREIAEANRHNEAFSKRVYEVLSQTTGVQLENKPEAWWEWWRTYNYRSLTDKPYNRKQYRQVDQARLVLSEARYLGTGQCSCLVAGTLVQTSSGLTEIEKLQVGDLVLSQDVESGKLDLKAVVRTTLRAPEKIYRIHTESGDIRATGGHRWWVAGKGWVMSIQLEPDMLFHNAKGTTKILSVEEEADPLPTHNLVVDGYHTYFVGTDRVLSFDNVDPIPTLRKVPGY